MGYGGPYRILCWGARQGKRQLARATFRVFPDSIQTCLSRRESQKKQSIEAHPFRRKTQSSLSAPSINVGKQSSTAARFVPRRLCSQSATPTPMGPAGRWPVVSNKLTLASACAAGSPKKIVVVQSSSCRLPLMDRRQRMLLGSASCFGGAGLIWLGLGSPHALAWWLGGIATFVFALALFLTASSSRRSSGPAD